MKKESFDRRLQKLRKNKWKHVQRYLYVIIKCKQKDRWKIYSILFI